MNSLLRRSLPLALALSLAAPASAALRAVPIPVKLAPITVRFAPAVRLVSQLALPRTIVVPGASLVVPVSPSLKTDITPVPSPVPGFPALPAPEATPEYPISPVARAAAPRATRITVPVVRAAAGARESMGMKDSSADASAAAAGFDGGRRSGRARGVDALEPELELPELWRPSRRFGVLQVSGEQPSRPVTLPEQDLLDELGIPRD